MSYKLDSEEVGLIIKPIMNEAGYWEGDISSAVTLDPSTSLSDEEVNILLDLVTMMSAFLDWSKDNPSVIEEVREHRNRLMEEMFDDDEEEEPEQKGDNVVSLTRWSKTYGNA